MKCQCDANSANTAYSFGASWHHRALFHIQAKPNRTFFSADALQTCSYLHRSHVKCLQPSLDAGTTSPSKPFLDCHKDRNNAASAQLHAHQHQVARGRNKATSVEEEEAAHSSPLTTSSMAASSWLWLLCLTQKIQRRGLRNRSVKKLRRSYGAR